MLAASAFVQSRGMHRPMTTYRDGNGVSQARIAWNYEKYGLWKNRLIPIFDKSPAPELTPIFRLKYLENEFFHVIDDKVVMAHYPPTLSLTLYAAFKIFGFSPFTTRLVPIVVTLLTLFVFFLTVRRISGETTALMAAFLFAMSPIVLAYGQMPDTIIFSLLSFLSALYFTLVWEETRKKRHLAGVLLSIVFGCSYGWFPYFLVPLLAGRHLFFRKGKFSWAYFAGVPATATLVLASFVGYLFWALGPAALHDWLSAYSSRRGDVIMVNETQYAITTFQFVKTMILRIPFHYTWPVFLTAVVWLWGMRKRAAWRPGRNITGALLVMLGFGVFPALMFKQGAYIHGFYTYLYGPAVCLCAAIMLEKTLRMSWLPRALAAATVIIFLVGTFPRTKTITSYLSIEKAIKFNDFLDQVADDKTVIVQDVFNLHTLLWSSTFIDSFVLQNELSHESFLKTLKELPPGYKLKYIHLPLPDAMRTQATEDTLAYLYRHYHSERKGDYIIFDTQIPKKPGDMNPLLQDRFDSSIANTPPKSTVNFQNKLLLESFYIQGPHDTNPAQRGAGDVKPDIPHAHVAAGGALQLIYGWRCINPVPDDYFMLVRIVPGLVSNDHEPAYSTILTSYWKTREFVDETYTIHIPDTTPPGVYPVEIALCTPGEESAFCLEPQGGWPDGNQQFTKIGEIQIHPKPGVTPIAPDPGLLAATGAINDYIAFYNLKQFEFYIDFIGVDPTFDTMIKGWKDILMGDKEEAIIKLELYSRKFAEFSMIEKMVSTAMQEVPAMLRMQLIGLYLEKHELFRAAREAASIAFNLPQSYRAYEKVGAQVEKNTGGIKVSFIAAGFMHVSDHFYARTMEMRPNDFDMRLNVAEHYLRTDRPEKAFSLLRNNLGGKRDTDRRAITLFAYYALRRGRTQDYRLAADRLTLLSQDSKAKPGAHPDADLNQLAFDAIMARKDHQTLSVFLSILPMNQRKQYWLMALDRFADARDYSRLIMILEMLDPTDLPLSNEEYATLGAHYETMGLKAYEAGSIPDAAGLYETAHELAPRTTSIMYNLSLLYLKQGRPDRARDMLETLLDTDPDDAGARALLEQIAGKKREQ